MAATGALLLLVAAGIFLAVSWDVLGLTARIAVVASITAAAILGGYRLRDGLPAVGAVLFHLGALLLPVDALGLALQLDRTAAAAWILTGAVAVLVLPPLAMAGRSRVLAAAAVVGVPVLATGLGLAGSVDPSLIVAVVGVLTIATLRLRGTRVARVWRGSPVALASTSVLLPLIAVVLDTSLTRGQVVAAVRAAGWAPSSWTLPTIVGVLAVATLAVCARLRRSRRLAALAPVLGTVATIVALLPAATPRLALLLVGPIVLLLVELVALITEDDRSWGPVGHWTAVATEALAALVTVGVAQLVVVPDLIVGGEADAELAIALGVGAAAFAAAALRRMVPRRPLDGTAITMAGGVALYAAAAMTVAIPVGRPPVTAILLLTAIAAALIPALTSGGRAGTTRSAEVARVGVVLALAVLACGAAWDTVVALPVAATTAPLVGFHARGLLARDHAFAVPTTVLTVPVAALASAVLAAAPGDAGLTGGLASGELSALVLQLAIITAALLGTASIIDRAPVVADVTRAIAVAVLWIAVAARDLPASLREAATSPGQSAALEFVAPVPALLLVVAPVAVWLVLDAVRLRRTFVAVLAAPVVVRLAASVVVGFGAGPDLLGASLLALGLAAATVAMMPGPRAARAGLALAAVVALIPGWVLIGATAEARAVALIALGLAGVAIGVVRRNLVVGHLGGVVATFGLWLLFDLQSVTALDAWTLPVAIQLAVAGTGARRAGTISSWVVDVPPLLLVAIPAITERLADGSGLHALLAGGVAIVAVVYGGASGRGGPLISGIAVLVGVMMVETVAYAALVPTWAWFALAGGVLLGAAVLIERKGVSPSRTVGRLKDLAGDDAPGRTGRDARG